MLIYRLLFVQLLWKQLIFIHFIEYIFTQKIIFSNRFRLFYTLKTFLSVDVHRQNPILTIIKNRSSIRLYI
jgi:hypothetical protein